MKNRFRAAILKALKKDSDGFNDLCYQITQAQKHPTPPYIFARTLRLDEEEKLQKEAEDNWRKFVWERNRWIEGLMQLMKSTGAEFTINTALQNSGWSLFIFNGHHFNCDRYTYFIKKKKDVAAISNGYIKLFAIYHADMTCTFINNDFQVLLEDWVLNPTIESLMPPKDN